MLTLGLLEDGSKRFSGLKWDIEGISQKMLTQTLRGLEKDGLVDRHAFPTVPVTVEYELTPLGHSLNQTLEHLRSWATRNMDQVSKAADNAGNS